MSEYDLMSRHELETRLRIADARLSCMEEQERRREKEAEFKKEFKRCKEFLEANGFIVMSGAVGQYAIV